jgi:hypothetical protein
MAEAKIVVTAEDRATGPLRNIGSEFDRFGSTAAGAIGPLVKLQGAIAAIGASAVVVGLKAVVGALDDLDEAAQGVGLTARSLAELRQAAIFAGVDSEKLDKSLSGLANRLSDAAKGGKESAALFGALGVAIKNNDGTLRSADDVLGDLAERFSQFRDGAEKTALANALFGEKLGRVLIPYLNQGRDGLKQYAGVTAEAVAESAKLQQEFDKLAANSARFRNELAGAVVPKINETVDLLRKIDWSKIAGANAEWGSTYKVLAEVGRQLNDIVVKGAQAQQALIGAGGVLDANDARARGRLTAPTVAVPGTAKAAEGLTEQQRAISQYIGALERALQATQDLSESEKAAAAIRSGAFGEVTPQVRQLIMRLAEQVDATKALKQIEAERAKQDKADGEERLRLAQAVLDAERRLQAELAASGQQRLDAVRQSLASEEQIERDRFKRRQEDLQTALLAQRVSEDEYRALNLQLQEDHEKKITDIKRREEAARLDTARAAFGAVASLMNSNSRKVFEIGKAGAIANATISTFAGIAKVWETWAAYPPIAAALTAVTLANGIAQVQRIKSTQFGGGGGSTAAGAVATPGQGPFDTSGSVATPGVAEKPRAVVNVTLVGDNFGPAGVRDLIDKINEQTDRGAEIRVTRG